MVVYWALFLILTLGTLSDRGGKVKKTPIPFIALAVLPTLFTVGLRWQIGPDWHAYSEIYKHSGFYSFSAAAQHGDAAYYLLMWALHQVHAPFSWLIFLCATIFAWGLGSFSFRQPNPWMVLLLALPYLVIVVAMSGVRQSAALGFLFFALNAYEKHHPWRCIALIVLGALFHASVLLMAPLCALSYSRNRLQTTILLLMVVAVAWLLFVKSFGVYAVRYANEAIQSSGIWYRLAMNALPAVIFLSNQRKFGIDDQQRLLWRNLSIVSLLVIPLSFLLPSNTSVDRFIIYLFPLQFFVLPRLPKIMPEGRADIINTKFVLIAYAALIQIVFLQFGTFARYYLPYRSIFGG